MKTTVQKLDQVIGQVQSAIALCSESKNKKGLVVALSSSVTSIDGTVAYLKENEKRRFIKVRKALSAVRNVMSGMCDGLNEDNLGVKEFRAATSSLRDKFFPMIRQGLLEELEATAAEEEDADAPLRKAPVSQATRNRIKISISNTNAMREAYRVVAQSNSVGAEVDGDEKLSELEAMSRLARSNLPVRIKGEFQIVRVPIVPVFPGMALNKSETLKRLGLKHVMVEGFVILQDQILLNISKQKAEKSNVTPLAMAHSVVELLNERGAVKYEIVSDTPNANPRNTDLLMFWIITRQRMSGIMKILGTSKTPAVVKWGLPLPSERADAEKARLERRQREEEEAERKRQEALEEEAAKREKAEQARKARKEAQKEARIAQQKKADADKKERAARQQENADRNAAQLQKRLVALVRKNQAQRGVKPKRK